MASVLSLARGRCFRRAAGRLSLKAGELDRAFGPVHPGEHLQEDFLGPLGVSQSALASDLGIPFRRVHEIVHGKRSITAETALLLARYFGNSPEFWLRLQADYDLDVARERMADQLARVRVRQAG